jgi:hypothetical protein
MIVHSLTSIILTPRGSRTIEVVEEDVAELPYIALQCEAIAGGLG